MSNPIGWCTDTWNIVTGCTPVSPACDHCYAERMSHRLAGRFGYPADEPFRVTLHSDRLNEPLRWRKPRRIFVCSMGDLFHEDVPDEFIYQVFKRVTARPQHTFQVLTKRPERMAKLMLSDNFWGGRYEPPLPNLWLGVTAENQEQADRRIPILLDTPAAVRFVSVEPMLGPVDLYSSSYLPEQGIDYGDDGVLFTPKLDWVICGGETGPGARLMQPEWARDLRDQCHGAGVPFWFKSGLLDGLEWHERPGVQ